ncbi:MAG: DUF1295 domain-containing protein [Candidatus Phocaeicola faecipullorum]|nr:DUF1295 domain-containing protein [Candidatus Phocaeicola faecipullorum]
MINTLYNTLMYIMPVLAVIVFIVLYFVKAGYGIFQTRNWGISLPNKAGWVIMECPAFITMFVMWIAGKYSFVPATLVFFILFEIHYFQRSFVFPFLMRGNSKMPVCIMLMGVVFNLINAFLIGYSLFYIDNADKYDTEWLCSPYFIAGLLLFVSGMAINLHSDHVIRNLRPKGDTRHYFPQKGMYRYVTSANYFGELLEWVGFAVLTQSPAAWVFVVWTFANLAPRAYAIRKRYVDEFGTEVVGKRKCLIPFIY